MWPADSGTKPSVDYKHHGRGRHLDGLEIIIISILLLRAIRAFSPAAAATVLGLRQFGRLLHRTHRRVQRWRDRNWRRPRYTLRCDLSEVEPGTCPVCLAPLAGEAAAGQGDSERTVGDAENPPEVPATPSPGSTQELEGRGSTRNVSNEPLLRLRCGHTFHSGCLDQWLDRRGTCPLCRAYVGDLRECVELLDLGAAEVPRPARTQRRSSRQGRRPWRARRGASTTAREDGHRESTDRIRRSEQHGQDVSHPRPPAGMDEMHEPMLPAGDLEAGQEEPEDEEDEDDEQEFEDAEEGELDESGEVPLHPARVQQAGHQVGNEQAILEGP
mmetsp:Transcript_62449/g.111586  ORF Transcript_62449/g.111586 Transcript_62449/m.111586 type:complete len:329 (-) Transcript_62449:75-1061(-)